MTAVPATGVVFDSIDDQVTAWIVDTLWQAGLHIMGSVTYNDMAACWPNPRMQTRRDEPFAAPMNENSEGRDMDRFANRARRPWRRDCPVKQQPGKPILAHGGARFAQSLSKLDLIDEYRLVTHPVALGDGLPLFKNLPGILNLKLHSVTAFPSGVVAHVYEHAERK